MTTASIKFFTLRGILGNMVNVGFLIDKILNDVEYQKTVIKAINIANFRQRKQDWRNVGLYVGAFVGEVIGFRIPGYEYIYGQAIFRDLFV